MSTRTVSHEDMVQKIEIFHIDRDFWMCIFFCMVIGCVLLIGIWEMYMGCIQEEKKKNPPKTLETPLLVPQSKERDIC